jgi:hypothetical protein
MAVVDQIYIVQDPKDAADWGITVRGGGISAMMGK